VPRCRNRWRLSRCCRCPRWKHCSTSRSNDFGRSATRNWRTWISCTAPTKSTRRRRTRRRRRTLTLSLTPAVANPSPHPNPVRFPHLSSPRRSLFRRRRPLRHCSSFLCPTFLSSSFFLPLLPPRFFLPSDEQPSLLAFPANRALP